MDRIISLAVASTYPILNDSMALLLNQQQDINIAGTADTFAGLQVLMDQQLPHLVLTSARLGDVDCATLTRYIKAAHPETRVIVFGASAPQYTILSAILAGLDGFVPLQAPFPQLLQAIRSVVSGRPFYPPQINKCLTQAILRIRNKDTTGTQFQLLTKKEQQILVLICREYTTKEIAQALRLEQSTVHKHRIHLLQKTGAKNMAGLVLYGVRSGIYTE